MNSVMQFHGNGAAARSRAHASYLMGSGSWSIPCFVDTTDRKPRPRRPLVRTS
jgi:hypothetical protein